MFCPECGKPLTIKMTSRNEEYIKKAHVRHGCGAILFWACADNHIWAENQLGMGTGETNLERLYSEEDIYDYRGL